MRSVVWPNPYDDGVADEFYIPFFEHRLMLKISPATYEFLLTVVAAYVNGEITESTALSAELLMFTNSWVEVDMPEVVRTDLHDFWRTVFKVTRHAA